MGFFRDIFAVQRGLPEGCAPEIPAGWRLDPHGQKDGGTPVCWC